MLKEPDVGELAKEAMSQLVDMMQVNHQGLGLNLRKFL